MNWLTTPYTQCDKPNQIDPHLLSWGMDYTEKTHWDPLKRRKVKACFDDFISLDLDGSFTLSADEFETLHREIVVWLRKMGNYI